MTNQISVEELLLPRLRQGEELALQKIIKIYLHPLRYYAWTFVKRKEVAEEIAHDAFVKLWQERSRFESAIEIKRFLYLVTKHRCLDHLKAADTRLRRPWEDIDHSSLLEMDSESRLIQSELMQAIYQEINKLPEKQREVFRLGFLEGLTAEEISLQLGISINAVYLNKSLAIKSLQRIFRHKGFWLYVFFLLRFGEH